MGGDHFGRVTELLADTCAHKLMLLGKICFPIWASRYKHIGAPSFITTTIYLFILNKIAVESIA